MVPVPDLTSGKVVGTPLSVAPIVKGVATAATDSACSRSTTVGGGRIVDVIDVGIDIVVDIHVGVGVGVSVSVSVGISCLAGS